MFFFRIKFPRFGLKKDKNPLKEKGVYHTQKTACAPSRKPVCVMNPENAPRMIHDVGFPKDFSLYEYAGTTLEVLAGKNSDGKTVRRPALVAKMARKYKMEDGDASIEMEMTASLRDLRKGEHPHADAIAAALKMYYEEKVTLKEKAVKPQKVSSVTLPAKSFPMNSFFEKVNPLTQIR